MKVLTIYAHHNPRSFCHAVLDRFDVGLREGGHDNEIVDLHAIGFDPVLRDRDTPNWIDDSVPDDVLEHMNLPDSLLQRSRGPLRRLLVRRWIGRLDPRGIVRKIHAGGGPRDVAIQQRKVAAADALAFVAPLYFVGFPAILKGWIERVFTLGFAFGLSPEGWRGDVDGRLPLLRHRKALILTPTIFDERSYASGLGDAMARLIDDFALRYPGIAAVQHEYFYAVHGADVRTRLAYLERAQALGRDFAD
ncbi:MAG TPA: NAD(P)H-dependent oxidoreductase [Burkholderiaceae bacterium]|nr:NAD(P)H-dependent oxidoreductase [Burkholderiaceae bacterium]